MNYRILLHKEFRKEFKRLYKKYKSLKCYFEALSDDLASNPFIGADLGNGVRKIRMAITSKGKGKSHGARVITYASAIVSVDEEGVVVILSIYDKAERDTISSADIAALLDSFE